MKKRAESKPYLVALVRVEALEEIPLRLASLREAVAYCSGFNGLAEQKKFHAMIMADNLPDPPDIGSAPCHPP